MKEKWIQAAILDWLAAKHILAFRMQVGTAQIDKRFVRFGTPGMADILAFRTSGVDPRGTWCEYIQPVWIECKAPDGKQSPLQKSFQQQVEEQGHRYVLARSIEDVEAAF